ncbi:MAG: DNA-binding beta-propeller fold protein YncE [Myxococcota bacterium]|jgi:DNA-binding beta-propeller fold protein YncE
MIKSILSCIIAVILGCVSVSAQNFKQEISLTGLGDPNTTAKPFGISYNPVNQLVYVAIAGSFGASNNVLAVIDPTTDTLLSTIDVGLFPEDIAFDPITGVGAVTNSTSGSVSFFDINNVVIASLQLPDPFGIGSCYPFGIVYKNGMFYVGTVDGSGEVYAINSTTFTLESTRGFSASYQSIGRMFASTSNSSILLSTTSYNAAWSGSTGGVFAHDLADSNSGRQINYASADNLGLYPSASAFANANGKTFMTGLDFEGLLYRIKDDGTPERAIPVNGHNGYGLATSADESLIVMCDLVGGAVVFIDAVNEEYFAELGISGMPNDAAFANGKLYVSDQANERVLVYDQIPSFTDRLEHDGSLAISNSAPALGDSIDVVLNGNSGQQVWLVGAAEAMTHTYNGVDFLIGPSLSLYGTAHSVLTIARTIPNNPNLSGRHFYMQGAVSDGSVIRTTKPAVLIIQ